MIGHKLEKYRHIFESIQPYGCVYRIHLFPRYLATWNCHGMYSKPHHFQRHHLRYLLKDQLNRARENSRILGGLVVWAAELSIGLDPPGFVTNGNVINVSNHRSNRRVLEAWHLRGQSKVPLNDSKSINSGHTVSLFLTSSDGPNIV